ncbi:hypothetical protein [Streptomyces noursei]|uniref:hypothetical protein n=1 Tax=Streptomyces noursei TaxID=1971 RepID=UPI00381EF828
MQVIHTPPGGAIAVMEAKEAVMIEAALVRYVAANPDSNLAVRMLSDVASANEQGERRAEEAAKAPRVASGDGVGVK